MQYSIYRYEKKNESDEIEYDKMLEDMVKSIRKVIERQNKPVNLL